MKRISFEDALILRSAKVARLLVRFLPFRLSLFVAKGIGGALYFFTKRRGIAHKNLRAAFAGQKSEREIKQIARRSMENLAMCVVDLLKLPDLNRRTAERLVEFRGLDRIRPSLEEGKGVIFLTAHFGSWEFLNGLAGLTGYPLVGLARAQKHPRSNRFLNSLRSCHGNQVIEKGIPVREILKALRAGRVVGILGDQDAGKNGVFVNFFGRQSSSPNGVAAFSAKTGAAVFPVFIFRTGLTSHRVEVEAPIRVPEALAGEAAGERAMLQSFADTLEAKIRRSPEQWLWAHRRWKSTPDRFVLVLSDGKTGHLNQSLAVFEALKEERARQGFSPQNLHLEILDVGYRSRIGKNLLQALGIVFRGKIPFAGAVLGAALEREGYRRLSGAYADVVISSGSSLGAAHLWVRKKNQAKSAVVMKPSAGAGLFDVVIAPRHDRMKPAENVFVTERALSRISPQTLKTESEKLFKTLEAPAERRRVGLLVGGDGGKVKFDKYLLQKSLEDIQRACRQTSSAVLAASSRRTPSWADAILKEKFQNKADCEVLVIANEANREGIVPGILGLSDLVVVTGESMSMVSEAVSAGKPVVVFMPAVNATGRAKTGEFLDRMVRERCVVMAGADDLYEVLLREIRSPNGFSGAAADRDAGTLRQAVRRLL
ncbi:MAG: mitochondrial fission ELM1 family protein [Candidatus Omnitrophica bacterium]|nr:mitochondrial fission ELM1 family protein [Candidatus Omnitrophota bacterium]